MSDYAEALARYTSAIKNRQGQLESHNICAARGGLPSKSKEAWDVLDAEVEKWEKKLRGLVCHAQLDGDCDWKECPQWRDDEPHKSGRSCPLMHWTENDEH